MRHSFDLRHPAMSKRMRTEAWIASERTADGDRILVAGLGQEGIPELDSLDTRSDVPLRGEHLNLAFVVAVGDAELLPHLNDYFLVFDRHRSAAATRKSFVHLAVQAIGREIPRRSHARSRPRR